MVALRTLYMLPNQAHPPFILLGIDYLNVYFMTRKLSRLRLEVTRRYWRRVQINDTVTT